MQMKGPPEVETDLKPPLTGCVAQETSADKVRVVRFLKSTVAGQKKPLELETCSPRKLLLRDRHLFSPYPSKGRLK
jgi:hypothetical protein